MRPPVCDESPPLETARPVPLTGPRDSREAGLLLFCPLGEGDRGVPGPRRSLRDRAEDVGGLRELPPALSSAESSSSVVVPPPRREDRDLDGVDAGEGPIGVSGTACSAAPGACGGRMSGSYAPPRSGTSGSSRRRAATSSLSTQMNWTNAVSRQCSRPKRSTRCTFAEAEAPMTSECQLSAGWPGRHHHKR